MIIIHDRRLPDEYKKNIKETIPSAEWIPFGGIGVYESILCHPDIYFFQLDNSTLIHSPDVPQEILASLKKSNIELIEGEGVLRTPYPDTSRYNAVRLGNAVMHNLKNTDPVILNESRKRGIKPVDVNQGYTRCSVLAVNYRSIITQDKGIAEASRKEGINVLLLSPGSILLPGEKYGFIGGAGGRSPDGTLFLLGDIRSHPQSSEIEAFLDEHGVTCIGTKGLELYDAGSLIFLDEKI